MAFDQYLYDQHAAQQTKLTQPFNNKHMPRLKSEIKAWNRRLSAVLPYTCQLLTFQHFPGYRAESNDSLILSTLDREVQETNQIINLHNKNIQE